MKGRKRKPNALRSLQGNAGRRPLPPEPSFKSGVPVRPAHLGDEAAAEWDRIVPELRAANLLRQVDRAALAAYCALYGRWVEAEQVIAREGMTYRANELVKIHPLVRVAQDSLSLMKGYLVEFGFTPASSSKATPNAPEQAKDEFEEYMDGPRLAAG